MLKIIADDLGLHKSVNDGIIFLLKQKKIDGASIMANGSAFDDAVLKVKESDSQNIGLHLVLVEEDSLTGIKLTNNHKNFFIKYILGLLNMLDIEKEIRAQLDKIAQAGIKATFLNGHQHLQLLPGILNIVIRLAKEYSIDYIRIVNEPAVLGNGSFFRRLEVLYLNFLSRKAKINIEKAGLKCNDYFVGFVNAGSLSGDDIHRARELSEKTPDRLVELGCHPGYESEDLSNKYRHWGDYNWQREFDLLKSQ